MSRRVPILIALAGFSLFLAGTGPARAVAVDVELALGVDVSGSTDEDEFALMINGYASAFRSSAVQNAIGAGPMGQIAVSMYFWTAVESDGLQAVKIPFTLVTPGSANSFADQIESLLDPITELETPQGTITFDPPLLEPYFLNLDTLQIFGGLGGGSGFTAVAQAIAFGTAHLGVDNGFEGTRSVLDISGDGQENVDHDPAGCSIPSACEPLGQIISPLDPSIIDDPDRYFAAVIAARNAAAAAGITINGLPIETDIPDLSDEFYGPYVITADGFVQTADDFDSFGEAVTNKLAAEIVPEPSAAVLLLLALSVFGARARRGPGPSVPGSV